ncbi:MAG TPA: hypothetical protein VE177_06330, partial [Candidatus Binatus sp.]|nr:hypothetical protein [Candidatus Binatus sp.]
EEEELAKQVAGEYNTFRVYLYMLKVSHSSSGQVQKALGFSSPTLAVHHLDKLSRLGLMDKQYDGTYQVRSKSFGILKLYVRTGRWILPRTIFFAVVFATMTAGFLFLSLTQQNTFFLVALALSIVGLFYAVYETSRFYRILPPA